MRYLLARHQPVQPIRAILLSGLGGFISIALTGVLSLHFSTPLLMAPFGASCVLLYSAPASPLSQPAHVIGGHVVATLIGLVLRLAFPDVWWAVALAVGLSIAIMSVLRITHPPAGADPVVVFASHPGFEFLIFPVLLGGCIIVAIAILFHRASGIPYPVRKN